MSEGHETVLVRVGSHRATSRLKTLLGVDQLDWYFTLADGGTFALIPASRLSDARAIPSITKARPAGKVMRCWSTPSVAELLRDGAA